MSFFFGSNSGKKHNPLSLGHFGAIKGWQHVSLERLQAADRHRIRSLRGWGTIISEHILPAWLAFPDFPAFPLQLPVVQGKAATNSFGPLAPFCRFHFL